MNTGHRIETCVETQDLGDAIVFGNGGMYRVASRKPSILEHDLLSALDSRMIDGENLIDDRKQRIEGWLDGIAAINRNKSVENFL